MKLPFEEWLGTQSIGAESQDLFKEAIICYKTGANKSALLFSYLALMTIIKNRILSAEPPRGYDKERWESTDIQQTLRDENNWEKKAFECTQRNSDPIFLISNDIRHQIEYFKNRRNDAAHGKSNKIKSAHVEMLWAFIESNLAKLVVSGSEENLVNRIKDHFDISITPRGADFDHLIEEIPNAVEESRIHAFFSRLHEEQFDSIVGIETNGIKFYDRIFEIGDDTLQRALINFLNEETETLVYLLRANPSRIQYFANNPRLIRNLWFTQIYDLTSIGRIPIVAGMLRNNLIPQGEQEEALNRLINRLNGETPNPEDIDILEQSGFYNQLHQYIFEDYNITRFNWANSNAPIIIHYFEQFGFDEETTRVITNEFNTNTHPWDLRDELQEYLSTNPDALDQINRIIENEEFERPRYLDILQDE